MMWWNKRKIQEKKEKKYYESDAKRDVIEVKKKNYIILEIRHVFFSTRICIPLKRS